MNEKNQSTAGSQVAIMSHHQVITQSACPDSVSMLQEARKEAENWKPSEEDTADFALPTDRELVKRFEKKCRLLLDEMIAIGCPLPFPGWADGCIHLEWIHTKAVAGTLYIDDDEYDLRLLLKTKDERGQTVLSAYTAIFESYQTPRWVAQAIKNVIDSVPTIPSQI